MNDKMKIASFSLPGLFEFYEFYKVFLPFYYSHKDYFYEFAEIDSIYGSPADCIFNGGRESVSDTSVKDALELIEKYDIDARLTFSNSLIKEEHLSDKRCNDVLKAFNKENDGVIIYSDLLLNYIKEKYPNYYFISSTTKVLTKKEELINEIERSDFKYIVPDFRFNNDFAFLESIDMCKREKLEFLCNECCDIGCNKRRECYEAVSRINMGLDSNHICISKTKGQGYSFSRAMESKAFISIDDIRDKYLEMGYTNFKIEGRGLGNALLLEFILYYMTKPECVLKVREAIYLNNSLDLF